MVAARNRALGLALLASLVAAAFPALVGAGGHGNAAALPAEVDPPNVIVLIVDDARVDDLETMPVVRSLIGAAGATFTNSYAPYPMCCPARATFLTGQYAHNHGVLGNGAPHGGFSAFDDTSTLATWLDADYATGWVGKYMNQYSAKCCSTYVPPGWDSWRAALGQSFADYLGTQYNVDGQLVDYSGQNQTAVNTDLAVDFIGASNTSNQPFMLFTSFFAPHTGTPLEDDDPPELFPTPYTGANRDALAGLPLSLGPAFNEAHVTDKPAYVAKKGLLRPWKVRALTEVNQQRRESLLAVERGVRRIVGTLRASGELDNTYIVFTSDNGFMLGEHRIPFGKNLPYEPAARVPLLIRGPGIPAGSVVEQPVGSQDIARSALSMTNHLGAQGDFVLDGVNLLRLIADPTASRRRPIVLESGPRTAAATDYAFHAVRTPQWKYIEYDTGESELYDLVGDPNELNNLAGDPAHAADLAAMDRVLDEYAYCAGVACRFRPAQ